MCDRMVEQFDAEEVTIIALSLLNITPCSQNIRRMAKPLNYLRFVFVDEHRWKAATSNLCLIHNMNRVLLLPRFPIDSFGRRYKTLRETSIRLS